MSLYFLGARKFELLIEILIQFAKRRTWEGVIIISDWSEVCHGKDEKHRRVRVEQGTDAEEGSSDSLERWIVCRRRVRKREMGCPGRQ